VVQLGEQLCSVLSGAGPSRLLDVDHLLQRESMDVIGRVGFGTDLGALHRFRLPGTGRSGAGPESSSDVSGGGGSGGGVGGVGGLDLDDLFPIIQGAAEEVARRLTHPFRYETRHFTQARLDQPPGVDPVLRMPPQRAGCACCESLLGWIAREGHAARVAPSTNTVLWGRAVVWCPCSPHIMSS
jgi:hypothetical protein